MHVRRGNWRGMPGLFDVSLDETGKTAEFAAALREAAAEIRDAPGEAEADMASGGDDEPASPAE